MEREASERTRVYKKNEHIVDREIAGEMLLVPVRGKLADMERIYSLNSVAAFVWQHLDGAKDLEAICQEILASYEVEGDQARKDLHELIDDLREADLIVGVL